MSSCGGGELLGAANFGLRTCAHEEAAKHGVSRQRPQVLVCLSRTKWVWLACHCCHVPINDLDPARNCHVSAARQCESLGSLATHALLQVK